jgi:hypothetical protein
MTCPFFLAQFDGTPFPGWVRYAPAFVKQLCQDAFAGQLLHWPVVSRMVAAGSADMAEASGGGMNLAMPWDTPLALRRNERRHSGAMTARFEGLVSLPGIGAYVRRILIERK